VEKLDALIVADRILYGSMYPLFCLKSTLLEVTKAEIDVESRNKILFSNSINIFRK
jgi:predicted TIM-barrel fold metal-dependent hydrolase